MPGLARNLTLRMDARALTKRPELAVRIAVISSLWTEVESHLSFIFAAAVGADPQTCHAMLAEVNNITTRVQMIARAVERLDGPGAPPNFKDYSLGAHFGKLVGPIRKQAGERGRVMHAAWVVHDDYPKSLFRFDGPAPFHDKGAEEWRLKDFLDVEERISEVDARLANFGEYLDEYFLLKRAQAAPPPSPPQSESEAG